MGKEDSEFFDTGKRLSVELGTQMQIEVEGFANRLKGVLVGMVPDEYMIVTLPYTRTDWWNLKTKLFLGNTIVIRYLYKGTIFGFQSTILGETSTPARLIFVKFPKIIEEHNLRSQKRMDCILPAKTIIGGIENGGIIQDISQAGCRYATNNVKQSKLFETNKDISITFQLPGVEGDITLAGKIRNIKKDSSEVIIGVEFIDIKPKIRNQIGEYISTTQ